jgi:hypothetical protein
MNNSNQPMVSQRELARRWGKPECSFGWFRAVGAGPHYVKVGGEILYPLDEVEKYERACLFFNPADVAFQSAA